MEQDRSFCRISQCTEPGKGGKCKNAEQFILAESEPESQKFRNLEVQ